MKSQGKIFYGWIIVAISLAIMSVVYGVYFSWSVFYVAILNEYGWSRANTALIFSLGSAMYGFAAPISGALLDRFGPRNLFISCAVIIALGATGCSQSNAFWHFIVFFSILVGFGTCSAGFTPNSALISNWFVKKRATALGIAQAGTREAFLMIPLVQLGILSLGWRNTYLVMAVITIATIIPLSLFLRARPQDKGLLPDGDTAPDENAEITPTAVDNLIVDKKWDSTDWTLPQALKQYRFWALFILVASQGFALTPIITHQIAFLTDVGFTAMFAASLLIIYAVMTLLGRFSGFLSDIFGRELTFTLATPWTIGAIIMLLFVKDASTPWMLYVYAVCFGYFSGIYAPAFSSAAADLFQGKNFGAILGLINLGYGVGAGIGNWLFGYIFDVTGTYSLAFYLAIIAMLVQVVSIWIASPRKVRLVAGRASKSKVIP